MHPYISLGHKILLDAYFAMLTAGIIAGSLVSFVFLYKAIGWWRAMVIVGIMIWGTLFGSHLAYCIMHWDVYRTEPFRILAIWRDGHSFLGAPAFCGILLLMLSKTVPGIPFLATADAFALGMPLGLVFARIGCYLRGCCWGIPIARGHIFYGISYKLLNYRLTALHPVQLYSAAVDLIIFISLLLVRKKQKRDGLLTGAFFFMYAEARFTLEFFRGDTHRIPCLWNLSIHQFVCIFLFLASLFFLYFLLKKGTASLNRQ